MTDQPDPPAPPVARSGLLVPRDKTSAVREIDFDRSGAGFALSRVPETNAVAATRTPREVGRPIAARPLLSPSRRVHLRVERFLRTMRLFDALDSRHVLNSEPDLALPAPDAPRLPAPPLSLTHAAPPLDVGPHQPAKEQEPR
jgi:hypothetical protein